MRADFVRSRLAWRFEPAPDDAAAVRALVDATGFFTAEEIEIAGELVEERLLRGLASGYEFVFADADSELLGYTCFGRIAGTQSSYDLYWIAVKPEVQGAGLGHALLECSEARIGTAGGRQIYIETSSRAQYAPTQAFYHRCGYRQVALLPDFYAPADGKLIYCKALVG